MIQVILLLAAFTCAAFGAEPIVWGAPVEGFRLGVQLNLQSSPSLLVVVLENNGQTTRNVYVGAKTGAGLLHVVRLTAIAPDGSESEIRNMNEPGIIAGVLVPIVVKMEPGGQYLIILNLDNLLDANWKDTFETLRRRRYVLRAAMKLPASALDVRDITLWGGELVSGTTPRVP